MNQVVRKVVEKSCEVIYKPYSKDVLGYCIHITDFGYSVVLNSTLTESESVKVYNELTELSTIYPEKKFILLQPHEKVHMSDTLPIPYSKDDAE